MKYFVVSDIHDRYGLMLDALAHSGFDPSREDHRLILCGDAFYSGEEPGVGYRWIETYRNDDQKMRFFRLKKHGGEM